MPDLWDLMKAGFNVRIMGFNVRLMGGKTGVDIYIGGLKRLGEL